MTEIDIAGLRALAQAVQVATGIVGQLTPRDSDVFYGPVSPELMEARDVAIRAWAAFEDATGPATVLALCDALAEQAREIERLRTAATDLIDDWEAGNDTVNHGIMMAVHGPGGVNSQSTAGEAQE